MAAKTWETDFRYAAISESVKALNTGDFGDDLFNFPGSYCVPVAKKPIIGWTPGRIFLVFMVLGFVLMGSGVFVMGKSERDAKRGMPNNGLAAPIGACLGTAGMACFFLPLMLDRFIMKLLVGHRASDLARRPGDILCCEISNADRSKMKISIDGDDYVLMLADYSDHRLLIEGIAARYLLRAKDVTQLEPFQFMNYVGAEITYRITEQVSLNIAIARVSILLELTRQVPVLFFLRRLVRNRILRVCEQCLRVPEGQQ